MSCRKDVVIIGLQLWLPLNGDVKNYGLCNAELSYSNLSFEDSGKIGKCLSTGGIVMSADTTGKILNNNAITISLWLYVNAPTGSTNNRAMIFGNEGTVNNNRKFSLFQYPTCNDFHYSWMNDTSGVFSAGLVTNALPSYQWTHIAVTYDNPNICVYINGELKHTSSAVSNSDSFHYTTNVIHDSPYHKINDFRLYDECLSPKQVKYISQAMICHYPMGNVDGKIGGRNLLRNSSMNGERLKCDRSQSCNSTTTLAYSNDGFHIVTPSKGNNNNGIVFIYDDFTRLGINIGDTITFSLLVKGSSDSNKPFINIIFQNDGTTWYDKGTIRSLGIEFTPTDVFQKIYVTYTLPTDKKYSSKTMFLGIHGNMKSDLYIKNLKLEKSSTSTPYTPAPEDNPPFYDNIIPDISGYQNNGEVTDSACPTWSNDSPRYLGSYEFNGKNQYISGLSPISNNTKEFTIAFWVKLKNVPDTMTFYTARAGIGSGVALFFINKNIRFDDNVQSIFNYTYDLSSNKWTHLCITRSNTSKKLYVNGRLIDSISKVGDMQNIGEYFTIGGSSSYGNGIADLNWLNGNISDFRIYSTVLSDEDVLDLYQSSASLDSQGNLMLTGEVIE